MTFKRPLQRPRMKSLCVGIYCYQFSLFNIVAGQLCSDGQPRGLLYPRASLLENSGGAESRVQRARMRASWTDSAPLAHTPTLPLGPALAKVDNFGLRVRGLLFNQAFHCLPNGI